MSKENDKCIAFSGIVEDIQSFTTDTYFADIWKSCFVWHLCWATQQQANETQGIIPRRASEYRAPSWSWLSIDGNTDIILNYDSVMSMVEILHVDIQNTSENRFSSIKSGHILGCGILKPARWGYKSGNIERHLLLDGQSIWLRDFWDQACPQLMMDVGVDEPCSDVLCLPPLSRQYPAESEVKQYVGIILIDASRRNDEYRRIGVFQTDRERGDDFLKEDNEDRVRTMLPQRTFTII